MNSPPFLLTYACVVESVQDATVTASWGLVGTTIHFVIMIVKLPQGVLYPHAGVYREDARMMFHSFYNGYLVDSCTSRIDFTHPSRPVQNIESWDAEFLWYEVTAGRCCRPRRY